MTTPSVAAIIPARYASTRLPGKPLARIGPKPMIQHVYERCCSSSTLSAVLVATDDQRILDSVLEFGGRAVLTRPDHPSGTDRIAEAATELDVDIVVNVQGDQPFISPAMIEEAVAPLARDPSLEIATLMFRITRAEDLSDPSVVKVVADLAGNALYFSRSLIPYPLKDVPHMVYEHVGTYAYRRETLLALPELAPTVLERVESLEQLRWLEHGLRVHVAESQVPDRDICGFSVDTPEDLARAEKLLDTFETA